MANEIVKYNNYMNTHVDLTELSSPELNLLMTICAKMKNRGSETCALQFSEIRKLSNFWSRSNIVLADSLRSTGTKLFRIECRSQTKNIYTGFTLFNKYVVNLDDYTFTVSVNPEFSFILNELANNFTRFELNEFVHLDGKYAKRLYIMLKQFRMVGTLNIDIESFRTRMGIPKSYRNKDITDKVIKPAMKELAGSFANLAVRTVKAKTTGSPAERYVFTFKPETIPITEDPETEDQCDSPPVPQIPQKTEKQNRPAYKTKRADKSKPKGSFYNFEQRDYDYDVLEKELLEAQERNSRGIQDRKEPES